MPPPPIVIVPLYIYPLPGSWDPLVLAAKAHPSVQFIAIVNPSSGPGPDPLPDTSCQAAITSLLAVTNISVVGYVHCSYCARDSAAVKADIDRYAGWETASKGLLRVQGIFIDEAPWNPDLRGHLAAYAHCIRSARLRRAVTATAPPTLEAAAPPRKGPLVIYNPGTVVARGYVEDADLVVVFEQSAVQVAEWFLHHGVAEIPASLRHKCVAIVHSVSGGAGGAVGILEQVRHLRLGGVYVTHQLGGGYNEWPEAWDELAGAVV
ncbi:Spherulin-4 [Vanrija pseudolonga]|uniref:Spherulin-4 n=1 Tax=Vanrija pseudolonga TaxID=143232 RepID=A0AAF0YMQ2_9TREE|nr:Spherulin-4 [Vanrija pseudolonga]